MTPRQHIIEELECLAAPYDLTFRHLASKARWRAIAWPRQEAYTYVREMHPHLSLPQIGRLFGGRDHTTVLHGIRAHRARMAWVECLRLMADVGDQPDLFWRAA